MSATSELPALGGGPRGFGGGLPSIGGRQGNFDLDPEYLKRCQDELSKLNEISSFDEAVTQKTEDGRSMLEVMREKRLAAEREIEEAKKKQDA